MFTVNARNRRESLHWTMLRHRNNYICLIDHAIRLDSNLWCFSLHVRTAMCIYNLAQCTWCNKFSTLMLCKSTKYHLNASLFRGMMTALGICLQRPRVAECMTYTWTDMIDDSQPLLDNSHRSYFIDSYRSVHFPPRNNNNNNSNRMFNWVGSWFTFNVGLRNVHVGHWTYTILSESSVRNGTTSLLISWPHTSSFLGEEPEAV